MLFHSFERTRRLERFLKKANFKLNKNENKIPLTRCILKKGREMKNEKLIETFKDKTRSEKLQSRALSAMDTQEIQEFCFVSRLNRKKPSRSIPKN